MNGVQKLGNWLEMMKGRTLGKKARQYIIKYGINEVKRLLGGIQE